MVKIATAQRRLLASICLAAIFSLSTCDFFSASIFGPGLTYANAWFDVAEFAKDNGVEGTGYDVYARYLPLEDSGTDMSKIVLLVEGTGSTTAIGVLEPDTLDLFQARDNSEIAAYLESAQNTPVINDNIGWDPDSNGTFTVGTLALPYNGGTLGDSTISGGSNRVMRRSVLNISYTDYFGANFGSSQVGGGNLWDLSNTGTPISGKWGSLSGFYDSIAIGVPAPETVGLLLAPATETASDFVFVQVSADVWDVAPEIVVSEEDYLAVPDIEFSYVQESWVANERIVFRYRKDGPSILISISFDGKKREELSLGDSELEVLSFTQGIDNGKNQWLAYDPRLQMLFLNNAWWIP